jgi:DNA-binding NarL/FixJ family response regulator
MRTPVMQRIQRLDSVERARAILGADPQLSSMFGEGGISADALKRLMDSPTVLRVFDETTVVSDLRPLEPELIEAIRQASEGKIYIEAGIAQQLAIQQLTGAANPVEVLSNREFEVFLHLGRGKSVAETADLLNLSPRTVGTHLYNIKQKLGASNAAEIALAAIRAGLIEP